MKVLIKNSIILIAIGMIVVIGAMLFFMDSTLPMDTKIYFYFPGFILFGLGLGLLISGISENQGSGAGNILVIIGIMTTLVSFAFYQTEQNLINMMSIFLFISFTTVGIGGGLLIGTEYWRSH